MPERRGVVDVVIRARDMTGRALATFRRRWRAATRVVRDMTRAVVASTAAMAGMVFGLQKLGAQGDKVIAVKAAFARMVGNVDEALTQLRAATQGTISDFELMARANQLMTLGVADTVGQIAEMVHLSRELGRAQGIDATRSLEIFTLALARQSAMRADDLGLALQGVEASKFQAEFMDQARRKVQELTGGMSAGAPAAARFATQLANLKDRLSEIVATSPLVASFFDGMSGLVSDIIDLFAEDAEFLVDGMKALGRLAGDAFSIGVNEGIEAFIDKGNWFGRWVAGFFGGNADVARGNFAANREALASIARAARAASAARAATSGGGGGGGGGAGAGGGVIPPTSLRTMRFMPVVGGGVDWGAVRASGERRNALRQARRDQVGYLGTLEPLFGDGGELDAVEDQMEDFGATAVAAFGGAAAAAIRGSDQIATSVISMITEIARSIPGVGGFGGAIIGAVGGIFGAVFGRRNRDPVPVRLQEVDRSAADALNDRDRGPERVTVIIRDGQGRDVEFYEKVFLDRQSRDEIVRYDPRGRGTPVGIR